MSTPNNNRLQYNLLLVGGSTSNFTLAHRLVDLALESGLPLTIAIVEKAPQFGGHIVSGAVINPQVIAKLFPQYQENGFPTEGYVTASHFSVLGSTEKLDLPETLVPPGLKKEGQLILSLSQVIRWMADQLLAKVKDVPQVVIDVFPGFAAQEILYEGDQVVGVRLSEGGTLLDDALFAEYTCFGDKGFISKDLVSKFNLRPNPQLWSVGVKELWSIDQDLQGQVWHTLGYPIVDGTFGGGFVYGLSNKRLAVGLILGLDSPNPNINPQAKLQDFKAHPWLQSLLKDGKLLKYGAAVIPEGGYFSLPTRFNVDGAMLLGDALGVLDAASLAGVDRAMETGYIAAGLLHEAFQKKDFGVLAGYQEQVMSSFVGQALYTSRYFRQAFLENERLLGEYLPVLSQSIDERHPWFGVLKLGLANPFQRTGDALRAVTKIWGKSTGTIPAEYTPCHENIQAEFNPRIAQVSTQVHPETLYSRSDAVFFANPKYHEQNRHIEEFSVDTCRQCISTYDRLDKPTPCISDCTAEVHRIQPIADLRLHAMSLENCIQCRTCEIVCPHVNLRVNPSYEGSGPDFFGL
jgi:electron-transferring-flavoprotein dehydrogenase